MPADRTPARSAGKRRSEPYRLVPPTTPTSQSAQPAQPPEPAEIITSRLSSYIDGLFTRVVEQRHSAQPTAQSWVATAREMLAAGNAAQREYDRQQFEHVTKILALPDLIKGVTRDIVELQAKKRRLREELTEAVLKLVEGSHVPLWRAMRMAVEVMVEAHRRDEEGCAVVRKELEELEAVYDPKVPGD